MKHFISRRDFLKVAGAVGAAGALAACGGSGSSSTAASTSASSSAASGAAGGNVSISLWTYPIGSWRRQTSVNRASIKNSWAMRAGTEPSCRGPSLAPHCRMTLA